MTTIIEFLAVISGALFGVLLARRKQMDFVGVFSVSFLASFGGGTLRDVLLDRRPLFWVGNPHFPAIVFCVAGIASLLPRLPRRLERWLHIPDALGMGLFSAVGTNIALQEGTAPFVAVLFGVITGTFGGVMGDVVCNEVPSLFRPATPLYATCAFAGGWILVGCRMLALPADLSLWCGSSTAVILRLAALRWNICLRAVSDGSEGS